MYQVQQLIISAVDTMRTFSRLVDSAGDIMYEEFEPYTDVTTWADVVSVNYYNDDWYITASAPSNTSTPIPVLAARLKPKSIAVSFGVVAVAPTDTSIIPVRKVVFYSDMTMTKPIAAVDLNKAVSPINYPFSYVALPHVISWTPGSEFGMAIYLSYDYLNSIPSGGGISVKLVLLPALKIISTKNSKYK